MLTDDVETLLKSVWTLLPFISSLQNPHSKLLVARVFGMSSMNSWRLHSVKLRNVSTEF